MSPEELKTLMDTVESAATSLAIVLGGIWAIVRFRLFAEHYPSVTPRTLVEVHPTSVDDKRILSINVDLRNTGRVPCLIDPSQSHVRVYRIDTNLVPTEVKCSECTLLYRTLDERFSGLFNVPIGGAFRVFEFLAVPSPGTYLVTASMAISRRQRTPIPASKPNKDLLEAWEDAVIVSVGNNVQSVGHGAESELGSDMATASRTKVRSDRLSELMPTGEASAN